MALARAHLLLFDDFAVLGYDYERGFGWTESARTRSALRYGSVFKDIALIEVRYQFRRVAVEGDERRLG